MGHALVNKAVALEMLVLPARFQRATFRLGGGRSMQLSYGSRAELVLGSLYFDICSLAS